ncbi:ABC transporter substrate-binding protein [Streptomyces luteolus]|uniref:ABC transporter substrate-binding protein n=1 Tax=Streptomyces luteolus TaxID=3043615 RepID=A0ABT6STQ1_9ACTN|nr:ABC transporter substrate-binding protein [Streptomyces sp. B-S-A12]MDI3418726.1 ABC transporter substrate-binding protein [Streptomyces sp. B-S-A12]
MRRHHLHLGAAMAVAVTLTAAGCTGTSGTAGSGRTADGLIDYLDYGDFGGGSAPQANYNPYNTATALGPTHYVFETLAVYNTTTCKAHPWLAAKWQWTDPKTLVLDMREGVKWNDGRPFSAKDVAFSYQLLKKHQALDSSGVWQHLSSVEATDADTVTMDFEKPGLSVLDRVLKVPIVPEHIWSKVKDPVAFTNAKDPVGTGPFGVKSFNPRELRIERNPDYWQADRVRVREIRFHKNDGGGTVDQLKLSRGEYDNNAIFVPDIKKSFVDRDPKHNRYWYPPGGSISVQMNLTKAPFDDQKFRRALTTAFDREKVINKGQLGYVRQASQTGLVVPGQDKWLPDGLKDKGRIGYDRSAAAAALTAAGYRKDSEGRRLGKDGKPLSFTFMVPSNMTSWLPSGEIVVDDLKALGFDVTLETPTPEVGNNDRDTGHFDMMFGAHGGTCNMFLNFSDPLSSKQTAPIGKPAPSNFVRWKDGETDRLLDDLQSAPDVAAQKKAIAGLTEVMTEKVPMIPLWYGAKWFQYQTDKAVGWPNNENPYAGPGDHMLIVTHLKPAGG